MWIINIFIIKILNKSWCLPFKTGKMIQEQKFCDDGEGDVDDGEEEEGDNDDDDDDYAGL